MRIIKRNGSEEDFNIEKIINAVKKANGSGEHKFLTDEQIEDLKEKIYFGAATEKDIEKVTRRLGDDIGKVYGWTFPEKTMKREVYAR